ncbi:MAG: helix-turn-helix transcriptional regulator [Bacteroidia bacterium]|nr:helix-turn-helix transcriptional regulator [Bacteroidia bacterium]
MSGKKGLLGKRIIELRKAKNMSQSDLAKRVNLSYAQIGRYETKGVQPPAEILKKMADALDTTVDFIINGATDEKAKASLKDAELIRYFKDMELLPDSEKNTLVKLIGAYIRDFKARQAYA